MHSLFYLVLFAATVKNFPLPFGYLIMGISDINIFQKF